MLVLARKKDQAIMIDDNIEITILEIDGDKVKLGISAPKDKTILRKELYIEAEAENKSAAKLDSSSLKDLKSMLVKRT